MRVVLWWLVLVVPLMSGRTFAQCVLDPVQPSDPDCVISFDDGTLALQTILVENRVLCGAGVKLCDSSAPGLLSVELWVSAEPIRLAASATVVGVPGEWVRVTWPPTPVAEIIGLGVRSSDPGVRLAGDLSAPTPGALDLDGIRVEGNLAFEITSRTDDVDQFQTVETESFSSAGQGLAFQSFIPRRSVCRGAAARVVQFVGQPSAAPVQLDLWDGLPNQGGHRLRTGSVTVDANTWAIVEWEPIGVIPEQTYYLGLRTTPLVHAMRGTSTDTYPDGIAYFAPGAQPWPDRDFAFVILGSRGPADQVTWDDFSGGSSFLAKEHVQSFVPSTDRISGITFLARLCEPPAVLSLWDGIPGQGTKLVSKTVDRVRNGWITAEWEPTTITPGATYFASIESAGGSSIVVSFDDPYPGGSSYRDGQPESILDLFFESLVPEDLDCRVGNVNGTGEIVLTVNGSSDTEAPIEVGVNGPLDVRLVKPSTGGNGKFVAHANWGRPTSGTERVLPASIGTTCFPFLLDAGATPAAVWNNIGKTDRVGSSTYFNGDPLPDPARAPTSFLFRSNGAPGQLPVGTVVTFQAVMIDPNAASPKGVSTTNAVSAWFQ